MIEQNSQPPEPSDDDGRAAFEHARAEAAKAGITQEGLRDPAAFVAAVAPVAFDPTSLLAAGFVAHEYAAQKGVTFYRRITRAETMPLLRRQIDGYFVFVDSIAITELTAGGLVQVSLLDGGDFSDGPFEPDSVEGQGLLRDSLAGEVIQVDGA